DQVSEVFEPRDEDKGDIARACFYMVARYNNLAGEVGVISDYEPNLALADYATGTGSAEYSTDDTPVYMGIMSDLLEWNRLDPVDDYEIHRNNLIYNNYQHNRNPFIDFPEWADLIWGDNGKIANPATDKIAVGENGPRTPSKPTTPTDPDEEDTPELPALISEHLDIIIPIAIGVAVVLIILIIVLVAKGKAKIKVRKGKITVVANKPTSRTKKKISANSTKNTADKKEAQTTKKSSSKNTKK
ncbi:MAG: endonuclease, partial [Bacilli bacterium]|nr:endonuclease [Bacilli bacterium]